MIRIVLFLALALALTGCGWMTNAFTCHAGGYPSAGYSC
jgi:uncharacterized protein YceK